MANRLLTRTEISEQIIEPWIRAVVKNLEEYPLKPGEKRPYPNPLGRDLLPLIIDENTKLS